MYDLITLGEVLLRLAIPSPRRFESAEHLDIQVGGAEANVAAGGARLGLRTAWISALPCNAWGERARQVLEGHGVHCRYVIAKPDARIGLYFLEYGVPPRPIRVLYDRQDSAFARLEPEEVDWTSVREARAVHLTGITPALGAAPRRLFERAIAEAALVSFDVNYRAALWTPAAARAYLEPVLSAVQYLFVGEAEAATIFDLAGGATSVLEKLARLAPKATVTLMRGEAGSVVLTGGRVYEPSRRYEVHVVDPIGAGDAYVGGFLWATLRERSLQEAIDAGTAVAALKCSTWGDIALVNARDVEELMAGGPDVRR